MGKHGYTRGENPTFDTTRDSAGQRHGIVADLEQALRRREAVLLA